MANLGGTATTDIDAPIDEVWTVVEDVLAAPEWQGGMLSAEALETDSQGRPTLVETVNDAKVKHVKTIIRFDYSEGPTRLAWRQEKGDIKSLVGSWVLEDLGDDRTRATYTIEGDPGRMLGMLIRGPVEDGIRKVLVDARPGELKERVENG